MTDTLSPAARKLSGESVGEVIFSLRNNLCEWVGYAFRDGDSDRTTSELREVHPNHWEPASRPCGPNPSCMSGGPVIRWQWSNGTPQSVPELAARDAGERWSLLTAPGRDPRVGRRRMPLMPRRGPSPGPTPGIASGLPTLGTLCGGPE